MGLARYSGRSLGLRHPLILLSGTHRCFSHVAKGGEITIGAAARDGVIAITVRDTGEGIPENMKEALFSPLATRKAKGTGLGLAVVKRIVEAHNGTITFESEEGKGRRLL
ncbi:MAG: ATP-binding protein [Halobacteriota archaeon]